MKILVCPDKFKGSLTAHQVCQAIEAGIRRHRPATGICCHPMSDGGDGMLDVLAENISLRRISLDVQDPLFRTVRAQYGISAGGVTAYVEMARASGLALLEQRERNCLDTTTFGTGQLILDALRRKVRRVVIGAGGSAGNDAGMGVAAALGYRFLDARGRELAPVGKNLCLIDAIEERAARPELHRAEIVVACDVQNPFFGIDGAACAFARQKGADDDAIVLLDKGLSHFARLAKARSGVDLQNIPGAGAAGGLGGGAVALLGARLKSGTELMIDITRLKEKIAHCDIVITGEGRLDSQTLSGKLVNGIVGAAQEYQKKVAVLCGSCNLSVAQLQALGISYCGEIMSGNVSLHDAMSNSFALLAARAHEFSAALGEDPDWE